MGIRFAEGINRVGHRGMFTDGSQQRQSTEGSPQRVAHRGQFIEGISQRVVHSSQILGSPQRAVYRG